MANFLILLAGLLLALHLYREYWARRSLPRVVNADFDGRLYRVGETVIAVREAAKNSDESILCFPGFLEDMRYFQHLYSGSDAQLILINNANYHSPFPDDAVEALDWPDNPYAVGTIEHDGFYLALALQHLSSGSRISLHGHSRGGAVVLEAGRQSPELTRPADRSISAVLEAPVLPGARAAGRSSNPLPHALISYLIPVVLGLLCNSSRDRLLQQPMMRPTNSLKTELCQSLYSVAKNYRTCVANVRSIHRWQRQTSDDVYTNYARIVVVAGERDDVLDNASLLASAERGRALNRGVQILRTEKTNHFISLERPEYLRQLYRPGQEPG